MGLHTRRPFLFVEDFGEPDLPAGMPPDGALPGDDAGPAGKAGGAGKGPAGKGAADKAATDKIAADKAAIEKAAADAAYARGVADGRRTAATGARRAMAKSADALAAALRSNFERFDAELATVEADAAGFFRALAGRWAGRLVEKAPLAAIESAGLEAFRHLRGVPHLVLRVSPELVEEVDALMKARGREAGFEGRLIVLGDDETAPGDVRLEWADGGVTRAQAAIDRAVASALLSADASPPTDHKAEP